jgi:hypothetical protein
MTARPYIPYAKPYKWIYVVSKNNKYGVIDSLGNYVLPIAYFNIVPLSMAILYVIESIRILHQNFIILSMVSGDLSVKI